MVSFRPSPTRLVKSALFLALAATLDAAPLAGPDAAALLGRFEEARSGKAIATRFTERRTLPLLDEPVVEKGRLIFEAPDKFRRVTDDGNEIISDGRTLWLHYPAFSQVERYPFESPNGPGPAIRALTQALQGRGIEETFRASVERTGGVYVATLEPRSAGLRRFVSRIVLVIDPSLRLVSSRLEGREGEIIETTYEAETLTPAGREVFTFTPTPGVRVVGPSGQAE